ncbi:hypothetical protein BP6252_13101 [Coleophoma cylindrospora]|uniref:Trichothecene 3-O-acetyltransferase n=1 Tax=Coleophoma cylindrospora TaxID=1849047 RepID=A0A3D8Q9V6_9HELO|nr:hypothetical protein BP6252_13101 [Coleophoma cylindrospora]
MAISKNSLHPVGSVQGGSFPHQLSPIDHLSPRIHVPKLLYMATDAAPEAIIANLRDALSKSIAAFPILAGSVGLLKGAPQEGTLAVQAPFITAEQILSVQDLRAQYAYDEIRAGDFRPDAVDGELVTPDLASNPSRVFLAQANLIRGGLILVCAVHHCVVDETGIFNIMKLWSTYCRGGDGASIVKPEWVDRSPLREGRGTGRLQDHLEYTLRPKEKSATLLQANNEYISKSSETTGSAVIFFPDESLVRLKQAASKDLDDKSETASWISTNDAICALIWSRVTQARHTVGTDATYTMFNMTVNGRSRMSPPMSAEYTGNVVFVSKAAQPIDALLATSSLADTAQVIRTSVLEVDDAAIRDKIQAVTSIDDIGRLAPGGYSSYQRNVGCSSWSAQPYYALDWGTVLGGACRRLRWRNNISDGIFVIFPRIPAAEDGALGESGVEIYLGLRNEALACLRQDSFLNEYVRWRCC